MENTQILRPLTGMEEWVIQPRFINEPSHAVITVAHIEGPMTLLNKTHVCRALLQSSQRFLYLRAVIDLKSTPGQSNIIELDPKTIPKMIDAAVLVETNDNWKAVVETEMACFCPMKPDALPWKVYFFKARKGDKAVVVHVADHLIEDGRATQIFFNQFLTNLSNIIDETKPASYPLLWTFNEKKSYLEYHTKPFSYWHFAKEFVSELSRMFYATNLPTLTPPTAVADRTYTIEYIPLSVDDTKNVVTYSKTHSVSVTSAIIAVALKTIKVTLDESASPSHYTVYLGIDMRPHYYKSASVGPFNDLFGTHADGRRDTYRVSTTTLTSDLAQLFDADTQAFVRSDNLLRVPPRMELYIPKVMELAVKDNGRTSMLTCASLGIWRLPEVSGKFKITEFYLTGPVKLIGPSIYLNLVTVDNKLNFTITFIDQVIPTALRERFLKELMQGVKELNIKETKE